MLAAAGLSASALSGDAYRLAIAVTAISLLISPIWTSLMHRVERVASAGLTTYREAILEAYSTEIEEVQRGRQAIGRTVFHTRVRYRAVRLAVYHRRVEKMAKQEAESEVEASGIEDTGGVIDDKSVPTGVQADTTKE